MVVWRYENKSLSFIIATDMYDGIGIKRTNHRNKTDTKNKTGRVSKAAIQT
jgi:hypothetical protein